MNDSELCLSTLTKAVYYSYTVGWPYFHDAFSFIKPFASGGQIRGTFAKICSLIIISLY